LAILATVILASTSNVLLDDGVTAETCRSGFDVNFNVNFKTVFNTLRIGDADLRF